MLVNIQRVSSASVQVGEETISSIGLGLLVLICAMPGDSNDTCKRVTEKITKLRLFKDKFGKMNKRKKQGTIKIKKMKKKFAKRKKDYFRKQYLFRVCKLYTNKKSK